MSLDEIRTPIFPLAGLVLFPDTQQVLHIFEPRYRQMTEDALAGAKTIGMVLPREESPRAQQDAPSDGPTRGGTDGEPADLYPTGCLGRIAAWNKLPDGRFLIMLHGQERFRILREEATDRLYRVVVARRLPEPAFDALPLEAQAALREARAELETRLAELAQGLDAETASALRERMASLDPIQLTHALAAGFEYPPLEKLALLEIADPLERCRQLVMLLDFHRAEARLPDTPRVVN